MSNMQSPHPRLRRLHIRHCHETSLGNVEYAIASAADEPAVAQLAELFIYDLQKSGELDALLKKYGL